MSVGTNIRYYRKLNNLSQQELAYKLGVTNKAISSWEKDRTEPNMGYVNKMCGIFGCNASNISNEASLGIKSGELSAIVALDTELQDMIEKYLKLSDEKKTSIRNMINLLSDC